MTEQARTAKGRSPARRALRTVAIVLLVVLLLPVAAFGLLQTGWGQRQAVSFANDTLAESGLALRIQGIAGLVPFDMTLATLQLDDDRGTAIEAEDLHVALSVADLLGGRVTVTMLDAARLAVHRAPETPPAPEAPPSEPAWPSLPVDIAIDRLDVDRLELGAAIAGEDVVLDVRGSFALGDSAGAAALTVERLDGRPGRLALTAAADPVAGTLALDLVAEEPQGGVVPALAGWDYDGPWRLALAGDGPLADWRGTLVVTAGPDTLADIRIAGALDLTHPRLAVEGALTPPAGLLPPAIAPEPVAVDLTASLGEETVALAGTASGRGVDLALDVTASLDGPIAVEGSIEAGTADLERALAGLDVPAEGDIRINVVASGPLSDLDARVRVASGHLAAHGWEASDVALDLTVAGNPLALTGAAEISLAMRQPRGPDVDLARYRVDAVALEAKASAPPGGPVTLSGLALEAGPTTLTGTVSLDPEGGPIGFDLALATDAALAAAEAELAGVTGRLAADLAGAYDPDAGLGWIEAAIDGIDLAFADPALAGLVGPSPVVSASGQIDTGYGLQGVTAVASLPGATLELGGDLPFGSGADAAEPIAFAAAIGSLAALATPLGFGEGELAGSLAVRGTVADPFSDTPAAAVTLAGESVVVAGQRLGTVTAALTAAPDAAGRVAATADVALESDYGPVRALAEAIYDAAAERITLSTVELDAAGARATGGLDIALAPFGIDGTLDVRAGRLATLAGLIGFELAGSASGRVALSASGGRQDARVNLDASALALPDAVVIDNLRAEATVTDLLGDPRFSGTARASTVATAVAALDNLDLDAQGSLSAIDVSLRAVGESAYLEKPFPLAVDAGASISAGGEAIGVTIGSLTADFGEEQLVIEQPVTIRSAGSTLAVTGLAATTLGGRISGDVRLAPGSSEVALDVSNVGLDRSAVLTGGIGMSAKIDRLSVRLSGPGARPSGTIDLAISGVELEGDPAALGSLSGARLQVSGTVADGFLSLDARMGNVTERPVTLVLNNILLLSLSPFAAESDHGQPIFGQLVAETALSDLNPLVAPSGDILLGGYADIDIRIGGVGGAPVLSGEGRITDGAVEVIETGTVLSGLEATIAGEGDRLTIRSLTARDRLGGTVQATGWTDFGDAASNIDIALNQFLAYDTDLAEAYVSGTIGLAGPLGGPAVSGDVTVRPAEVRFSEISTAGYVEVDAIDINGSGQLPPEQTELTPPLALPLDLHVRIPNAFYIRGYGLESEWSGDLRIGGTTADPTVVGTMTALRGTLDLAGQAIEIGRGIITFTGASPPDPLVDIEAVAVTEDISVSLIVTGPASATDFKLQSVPDLPQEEIMNRLLFGMGRGGLSGSQAFQAGRALALITGREGDLGLVNTLRSITGITGLTVETAVDDEGLPAARIGGYLTEDVFLSVTRGTATGSGQAEISVEVFDGVDVRSSVTETGDSNVSVNFEWDY